MEFWSIPEDMETKLRMNSLAAQPPHQTETDLLDIINARYGSYIYLIFKSIMPPNRLLAALKFRLINHFLCIYRDV